MQVLAPSILSADFSRLGEEVKAVEEGGAGYIHVDVMDGHFVPNITFGAPVMKWLVGQTALPFDVHLMIENPERYVSDFVTEQTAFITVHAEAVRHLDMVLNLIKSLGVKAGVALNPATPLSAVEPVLPLADQVLIMTVNPGFGGQKLIPYALEKVRALDAMKKRGELSPELVVAMDGGACRENMKEIWSTGVNLAVAGSAVFKGDRRENCRELLALRP